MAGMSVGSTRCTIRSCRLTRRFAALQSSSNHGSDGRRRHLTVQTGTGRLTTVFTSSSNSRARPSTSNSRHVSSRDDRVVWTAYRLVDRLYPVSATNERSTACRLVAAELTSPTSEVDSGRTARHRRRRHPVSAFRRVIRPRRVDLRRCALDSLLDTRRREPTEYR